MPYDYKEMYVRLRNYNIINLSTARMSYKQHFMLILACKLDRLFDGKWIYQRAGQIDH